MITKEKFAAMQDHSILEADATLEDTKRRCDETLKYGFFATYVHPCHVKWAREYCGNKGKIGTVIGFPLGANKTKVKIFEAMEAIEDGADKLDFVANISMIKSGNIAYVENELKEIVQAVKDKTPKAVVKVIIECAYLTNDEKAAAIKAVLASGADYIKTSTGYGPWGCRIGDVRMMKQIVGDKMKIKAAADLKDINQAMAAIEEGADAIGENSAVRYMEEFDKQIWFKS